MTTDRSWRLEAACRGMDPNLFVPDAGVLEKRQRRGRNRFELHPDAVAACARCPVAEQCAAWAKAEDETLIVAAGRLTHGTIQRVPLGRRPNSNPQCGTESGYHRHRYLKEEACEDCRRAHAATVRDSARRNGTYRRSRRRVA